MRVSLLAVVLTFYSLKAPAQPMTEAALIKKFEASGFKVLNRYEQLLNADARPDLALIFSKKEDALSTADRPIRRVFVLATSASDNKYSIVVENQNLIYYYNYDANFKESFVDIVFEKRKFTINHCGGLERRWNKSTTFFFSPKENDWFFERDETRFFLASNSELEKEKKIVTAKKSDKISIKSFDIYSEWK